MSNFKKCFSDASELRKLLSRNWIEGLLYAHDKIATRRMSPTSVSASVSHVDSGAHALSVNDGTTDVLLERLKNYQEHGNNIKVVRIEKTIEPLGATVKVSKAIMIIVNIIMMIYYSVFNVLFAIHPFPFMYRMIQIILIVSLLDE